MHCICSHSLAKIWSLGHMELQRSLGNVAYLCDQEKKEKKIVTDVSHRVTHLLLLYLLYFNQIGYSE